MYSSLHEWHRYGRILAWTWQELDRVWRQPACVWRSFRGILDHCSGRRCNSSRLTDFHVHRHGVAPIFTYGDRLREAGVGLRFDHPCVPCRESGKASQTAGNAQTM